MGNSLSGSVSMFTVMCPFTFPAVTKRLTDGSLLALRWGFRAAPPASVLRQRLRPGRLFAFEQLSRLKSLLTSSNASRSSAER